MQNLLQRGVKKFVQGCKTSGQQSQELTLPLLRPNHQSDRVSVPLVEAALGRTAEKEWVWEMLCAEKQNKKRHIHFYSTFCVCKGGRGGTICLEGGFHNWKYLIK